MRFTGWLSRSCTGRPPARPRPRPACLARPGRPPPGLAFFRHHVDQPMTIPALTTTQMAEVDRPMIEEYGTRSVLIQMMENAGRSLAELARRMRGGKMAGRRIVVLCGAGTNGGGG